MLNENVVKLLESSKEYDQLNLDGFNENEKQMIKLICELINLNNDCILNIKSINDEYNKLQAQNYFLEKENEEMRKKLSKITDTKIGKFGISMYKKLKVIKGRFLN